MPWQKETTMKKALVVVVSLILVLGVGCDYQSTTATSRTQSSPTPPPPLGAARVDGKWKVIHAGDLRHPFLVSFKPTCSTGPCGGTWIYFYVSPASKLFHRVNHGTFSPFGNGYRAVLSRATLSWCYATTNKGITKKKLSYHDRAVFVLTITAASMIKKQWMATGISGVETDHFAPGGCATHSATYRVEAAKSCWLDRACR
jgi:hypothetical protein